MMVINPIMSNKSAIPTVATASPKLDSDKKPLKRRDSSKRASESLKRNTAKDLKPSKAQRSDRSNSPGRLSKIPGPLTRKVSRKTSSKSELREKKEKKKKKIKKVSSDNSLHKGGVENADRASDFSPPIDSSSTHSELSKKKPKRIRSSRTAKKALHDGSSVAEHLKNNEGLGGSEHTQSTKTSDSTVSTKDTSDKGIVTKEKKPLEKTSSKKGPKKKEKASEEKEERSSPPKPPPSVGSPRNRQLSFESIHGKSIHITPKKRRGRGNSERADKFLAALPPPPPSPQILGSPQSTGGKKKSVLKAKREKQEKERRASLDNKKNESYVHEMLDIVHSSTPKTKGKYIDPPGCNNDNNEDEFIDPDECSSQSSSCSIVSDGSYEKDDLMSNASERSDDRGSKYENFGSLLDNLLDENPSFGEHSITIDDDHELSPSKVSPNKVSLISASDAAFNPDCGSSDDEFFENTLMSSMTTSMSALMEISEDDSPMPSPEVSARRKTPIKSALKNIPETASGIGGKVRRFPKRAMSDITCLNRMSNNLLEIRLPGQRKTITRQRSLTFNEKVRVKRVTCQAQVCEGDTSDLWFQPQEYDAIKRKTMALIRAVQDDQTGGVTYCTRGLERYFSVDAVQEKRNDAWDSVLDEQEAQRSNKEAFSADRLSMAYSQTTRASTKEALARGKLDQDAIARYTKKMRSTLRRTYSNAV